MDVAWKDRFTTRISAFSGAFAILASGIIAYTTYSMVIEQTEKQALDRLSSSAQIAAEHLSALGTGYEKDLWLLASQSETKEGFDAMLMEVSLLETQGIADEVLRAASLVDNHGGDEESVRQFSSLTDFDGIEDLEATHKNFDAWFDKNGEKYGFHNFLFIRPDGLVFFAGSHQDLVGTNILENSEADPELHSLAVRLFREGNNQQIVSSRFFHSDELAEEERVSELTKYLGIIMETDDGWPAGLLVAQIEAAEIEKVIARDLNFETDVQSFLVRDDYSIVLGHNLFEEGLIAGNVEEHAEIIVDNALASGIGVTQIATQEGGEKYIESYIPFTFMDRLYAVGFDLEYDIVSDSALNVIKAPLGILVVLASFFIAAFSLMMRSFTRPLKQMQSAFQRVAAEKDFGVRIPVTRQDEVGVSIEAVNRLIETIDEFLFETQTEANQLFEIAANMRMEARDLSENTESQTATVEELSSSLEETGEQIAATSKRVSDTREITEVGKMIAKTGQLKAEKMSETMNDVNNVSADIEKIIGVINAIAFQTNILSLNASVEAARAGQEGKGFAAVAVEVGNLAKRSADAARESEQLIGKARETIQKGVEASKETREQFLRIAEDVNKTAGYISEIEEVARNQTSGVKMIKNSANHLANTATNNALRSERLVDVAREMENVSARFKETLKEFSYSESMNSRATQRPSKASASYQMDLAAE